MQVAPEHQKNPDGLVGLKATLVAALDSPGRPTQGRVPSFESDRSTSVLIEVATTAIVSQLASGNRAGPLGVLFF